MAQTENFKDHYFVVGDDDGRWFVTDGMCIIGDYPFGTRESAEERRDELNLNVWNGITAAPAEVA